MDTKWTLICIVFIIFQVKFSLSTSISADVKIWDSNTDFNNELNWKDHKPPCMETLDKRLIIGEKDLVISVSSPLSALGSIISLPDNVLLLLYDDNITLQNEPQHHKDRRCDIDENQLYTNDIEDYVYTVDGDSKSWFNPYNWKSSIYDSRRFDPHSHQIPCWHDIAIFGQASSNQLQSTGFKVDFHSKSLSGSPRSASDSQQANTEINIRVSELIINNISYGNDQLAELLHSDEYGNRLFNTIDDEINVDDEAYSKKYDRVTITVDSSSLNEDKYCTDDAGCICGNEDKDTMTKICSFVSTTTNDPDILALTDDDLTCDDPIYSSGYCNKLCASVLDILIIPSLFQARFFESFVDNELYVFDPDTMERKYQDKVHIVARRVYYNKFEVTFIDGDGLHGHELATKIQAEILKDLRRKNMYGIRSVSLRYSSQWRLIRQNHLISSLIGSLLLLMVIIYVYKRYRGHIRISPKRTFVKFTNDVQEQIQVFQI